MEARDFSRVRLHLMENELFERAPISKAYMKMELPVVMGMIVTLVYNLVDTYFLASGIKSRSAHIFG